MRLFVNTHLHYVISFCTSSCKMAKEKKLDEEFGRIISDIKPHTKGLPYKSDERHRVTLWIKKLLAMRTQREERNGHARQLLEMLKCGKLEGPFTGPPPLGALKTAPHSWSREKEVVVSSSPLNTFLQPPKLTSPFLFSSAVSSHKVPGNVHTTSPIRQEEVATATDTSNSTARHFGTAANYFSLRGQSAHPVTTPASPLSSLLTATAAQRQHTHHLTTPSHRLTTPSHHPTIPSHHSATPGHHPTTPGHYPTTPGHHPTAPGHHPTAPGHRPTTPGHHPTTPSQHGTVSHQPLTQIRGSPSLRVFAGKSIKTSAPGSELSGECHSASPGEATRTSTPLPLEHDFRPSLTSSVKGEGVVQSVGVVLSHDQDGSDSVDFRPLSVCSDESFSGEPDETTTLQATPRPHPMERLTHLPSTAHAGSTTTAGKLSREILQQREVDLLLRSNATRHQEEKLRLQREHENSIQQLLQRRSKELEEVRKEGKGQLEQLQMRNKELEKTIADLQRKLEEQKMEEERGCGSSRHPPLHQQRYQLQTEFDKKLHKTITDFERQKLEQEQRHAKHVQQVVGDCGRRIDQMERDCAAQTSTSAALLAEMEGRVQELTHQNTTITSEKESLKKRIMSLESELQESHKSMCELRERVSVLRREKEEEVRLVEAKMEARLREKEKQYSQEEARLMKEVRELEQQLQQWMKTRQETEESHYREMTEMKTAMEGLQSSLRVAESRADRMRAARERQTQQAEVAIEEFKAQVEQQSCEVFSSLRGELERLAAELVECRRERDGSAEQWGRERREERERTRTHLQAMEASHSQEKEELLSQLNEQLNNQHKKMEKVKEQELCQLQLKMSDMQTQAKATASRTAKTISSLEDKIQQLQQEAETQKSRHSRDTARLRKRIDEARQNATKVKEAAVAGARAEWQEERKRAKMAHQREMNTVKDKHNLIIQQMERHYATESVKSTETIGSLQAQVKFLKTDMARQESSHKEQLAEAERASEGERASLTHHHELMLQSVRQEADANQQIVSQLQQRVTQLQQDHENKLSQAKLHFQTAMTGLMPMAVRKEYNDTIQALRSQVELLEQRRSLLQQELEQYHPRTLPS